MRKPLFVALGALASFLVATATLVGTASAHATFSVSSVPADSQVTLYMDVPHERADGIHNVKVVVAMPSGWSAVGCQQKATWSCGIGSQSGRPVVQFTKDAGAGPAEDEGFVLTVRTGGVGTSSLPVLQTYSTGEEVGWIGAPGSPLPAPVLRTTAVAPPTTAPPATAPPVTAPPATNAPAVPGGGATTGGPTATTVAPGAAATSDATTADGDPATVDTGAEPTAGADVATTDGTTANEISDGELASAAGGGSDSSAGVVLAVVAALVVLGTAGGVVVVRARRRPGGDGPLS